MSRSRRKPYHHGDLRRALLEVARELVETEGPDALSFRRLADAVDVSHAAPLAHFPDRLALDAALATLGFQELRQRCEKLTPSTSFLPRFAAHPRAASSAGPRPASQPVPPTPPAPAPMEFREDRMPSAPAGAPGPPPTSPHRTAPPVIGIQLVTAALVYLKFALDHPGLFRMMHQPRLAERISESAGELPSPLRDLLQEKAAAFAIFVELVRQGQERGELKRGLPPGQVARLVTALVEGLAHQYLQEKPAPGQDRLRDAEALLNALVEGFAG